MALPRALVPASSRSLTRPTAMTALLPARALPVAARVATLTLATLAAEHLVRAAANRALASLGRAGADRAVRVVVTEVTVVEHFHRD